MLGSIELRQNVLIYKGELMVELDKGIVNEETLISSLDSFLKFRSSDLNLTEGEKYYVAYEYMQYLYHSNVSNPEDIRKYIKHLYLHLQVDCDYKIYSDACYSLTLVHRSDVTGYKHLLDIVENDDILMIDCHNRKLILMACVERLIDTEYKNMELLAKATRLLKELQ